MSSQMPPMPSDCSLAIKGSDSLGTLDRLRRDAFADHPGLDGLPGQPEHLGDHHDDPAEVELLRELDSHRAGRAEQPPTRPLRR